MVFEVQLYNMVYGKSVTVSDIQGRHCAIPAFLYVRVLTLDQVMILDKI